MIAVTTVSVDGAGGTEGPLVLGAFAAESGAVGGKGSTALGLDLSASLAADFSFVGRPGQISRVSVADRLIVIVGLGDRNALTRDVLRDAAMYATASISGDAATSALALELGDASVAVRAVIEGAGFGAHRYQKPSESARQLRLAVVVAEDVSRDIEAATRVVDAVNWVRQLVETPANLLPPEEFAAAIERRAAEIAPALQVIRWDAERLARNGFGATLAVGAGSANPPLLVELTLPGVGAPIALAGKGITFDAGGINLKKDPAELVWMKSDMAAAASIAAAVMAVAAAGFTRPIHALLPIAENLASATAVRPGDVVTHPNGRTTEVSDTDSEGRLVLADAIAYLAGEAPREIIDVGTLTDSGALGAAYWGCWGTSPELAASVVAAGSAAGEPGWALPLHDSYSSILESRVADSVNAPLDSPDTGQIAATYLRPFAGEIPWLHIDNGAGAYLERPLGPWPAGPTGSPARSLIEYLGSVPPG